MYSTPPCKALSMNMLMGNWNYLEEGTEMGTETWEIEKQLMLLYQFYQLLRVTKEPSALQPSFVFLHFLLSNAL